MTTRSPDERPAAAGAWPAHRPFLDSAAAAGACRRELDRFTDALVRGLTALEAAEEGAAFDVRCSPDRCIVQLGPVALTTAWLRGASDSVADGELMVIGWRGVAGRGPAHDPERTSAPRAASAAPLWEEVLAPVAADEAQWRWQGSGAGATARTSPELAAECVERLHRAFVHAGGAAAGATASGDGAVLGRRRFTRIA